MKHYKNIVITGAITTAKEESLERYKILVEKLSQYTDNIYSPIDTIESLWGTFPDACVVTSTVIQ